MFCNIYRIFGEATVREKFCKFTAFVNKVFYFLGFAFLFFIFSLLSLLSLFFLSLSRLPNTPLEDDNSRDAWLSLLSLKRKEASLVVGLCMLSSCTKSYG